mgnify:CR=1 FL=1
MRICVIGAGALGGSIGGRLARHGQDVTLVDTWHEHVDVINLDGLKADGAPEPMRVRMPAYLPEQAPGGFDMALVATDANATGAAAQTAARILRPEGFVLQIQNGIGNVEALVAELGGGRVLGGSTMCSFRREGPGHVVQTHTDVTTIGELSGEITPRARQVAAMLEAAGYPTEITADITTVIWTKLIVNCAINPVCAVTGLRVGEVVRLEATDRFQDVILDEIFAVVRAKGFDIPEAAMRERIKNHCWSKYSEPSMLQNVNDCRSTEIDAINGALVREVAALGVPTPFNEALTLLVKGREAAMQRQVHAPDTDWAALERAVAA